MSVLSENDLGPWSEAAYLALPEDHRRIELLDGSLLVSPWPTSRHQWLTYLLTAELQRLRPTGTRTLPGANVRVGPARILIPDVVVVRKPVGEVTVFAAGDVLLVLEIVSPGSVAADRAIKPPLYAQAGIPIYVRVEKAGPTAHVFVLREGRYELESSGTTMRLGEPFGLEIDLVALVETAEDD